MNTTSRPPALRRHDEAEAEFARTFDRGVYAFAAVILFAVLAGVVLGVLVCRGVLV